MNTLLDKLDSLWTQAESIWIDGGWAMIAIAVVSVAIFGMGTHIYLKLRGKGFESVPERKWRKWLDDPSLRRGHIGELLDFVTGGRTIEDTAVFFKEYRTAEVAPFERDLRVMKICVTAAPLLGLLGTVTGMLTTFGALATGSGGEKTMAMVASGISEALITTETGLVIALPGLFFQYQMSRKFDRYKSFLAHLETVCTQQMYKRGRAASDVSVQESSVNSKAMQPAIA